MLFNTLKLIFLNVTMLNCKKKYSPKFHWRDSTINLRSIRQPLMYIMYIDLALTAAS